MVEKLLKGCFLKKVTVMLFIMVMMTTFLLSTESFAQSGNMLESFFTKKEKDNGLVGTDIKKSGKHLARNTQSSETQLNVRLNGVTEYEIAEVFGRVVGASEGVIGAKRYSSQIVTDNPHASFVSWKVRVEGNHANRLQSNIMSMVRQVVSSKGAPTRFTATEINLLKSIRPGSVSGGEIQFAVGR